MTALESIEKLAADAREAGLEVRFCHGGVLVVATPENGEKTERKSDQPGHVSDGIQGGEGGHGQGESQAQQDGTQGSFDSLEEEQK